MQKDNELANYFNKYCTDIGPNIAAEINIHNKHYLRTPIMSKFQFAYTNANDVVNILLLNGLPSKTCSGHDFVLCKLLKELIHIASPISIAVNQTIHTEIFPDRLKIAKVIPLFKKGDNSLFENNRSISLLPQFSKIFENIFVNQLYDYFYTNNLLYNNQFGLIKTHSAEHASLELIDRIQQQLDTKADPFAIFVRHL